MYIIRNMIKEDWKDVSKIYQEGIETGLATFATGAPCYEEWDKAHRDDCRLVICGNSDGTAFHDDISFSETINLSKVLGWAVVGQVFSRPVYNGVVELSIYISKIARRKGLGEKLLNAEIKACEEAGIWTIQSLIFTNNKASLSLHEKCGFKHMCIHEKLGCDINGNWRDVTLMEYRSPVNFD